MPPQLRILEQSVPVYRELPGWETDISGAQSLEELPVACRDYLKCVEDLLETEISLISVGPARTQTIIRKNPFAQG
jgi:adenylosuccinate synthase